MPLSSVTTKAITKKAVTKNAVTAKALHQRTASLIGPGLLLLIAAAPFQQAAQAEVLVRAQGRCKLTSDGYVAFDGHCTFKHKAAGGQDAYVVKLDDGNDFIFSGPNPQALQLQTYSGIKNVRHNEKPDHDVFLWNDGGKRRLAVKLDQVQNPDATFDDSSSKATGGALLGAGLGALIGGLIAGNSQSSAQSTPQETARVGAPVSSLQSLVGVKGASAERELTAKGYTYRGGDQIGDSAFSYWEQPRTDNCVAVRTSDGRYQAITYIEPTRCR
ncbi:MULTISPECIES: hypothetical protein [Aphanothece]|uniref:hypothetical protein n=1 Tax=Aphanothece TaxID=1121 RepID=UPI00398F7926